MEAANECGVPLHRQHWKLQQRGAVQHGHDCLRVGVWSERLCVCGGGGGMHVCRERDGRALLRHYSSPFGAASISFQHLPACLPPTLPALPTRLLANQSAQVHRQLDTSTGPLQGPAAVRHRGHYHLRRWVRLRVDALVCVLCCPRAPATVRARGQQQLPAHRSSPPAPCSNNALYSYAAGVYSPVVTSDAYEDHAVTLVGYTDMWINSTTSLPVWIIKNRHAAG